MTVQAVTRALVAVICLISWRNCKSFNVDTKFPVFYSGPNGSYFGYTVALHQNTQGPVALVGAPKANSTTLPDPIYEPGALFQCNISSVGKVETCEEIAIMQEGNTVTRNGTQFSYYDRKDSMWLGVTLDIRQNTARNDIVVCGHRWQNQLYARQHLMNGICYIIDTELHNIVTKLLPLVKKDLQAKNFLYYLAYGQVGISAAYSEDGLNLILGAPGILDWAGSTVSYTLDPSRRKENYTSSVLHRPYYGIDYNSYFGYSVSTGKFFISRVIMSVVGIPRGFGQFGEVFIVNSTREGIHQKLKGTQLCEYFGASVLGVNLNADSYTDLLVGAPLHSLESAGDEGKVYVYISDGFSLVLRTHIVGDRKPNSRFGTCIANIGDINQDGFTDIAVGAPYENGNGAVYIYHSDANGLKSQYEQKIEASYFDRKLSGFGIHISRGVDIDNNGYPDILVGSYASANAVLFRSRAVVEVYSELIFHPEKIHMDVTCESGDRNITCVQIKACLEYHGKHVPSHLEFQQNLLIHDDISRVFFGNDTSRSVNSSLVLDVSRKKCLNFTMFVRPEIKDFITPIQVQFSHKLKSPSDFDHSNDKIYPIYHMSSVPNVTSSIHFHNSWCADRECLSNLVVSALFHSSWKKLQITLGSVPYIIVVITVRNEGSPAYFSQLYMYLPREMPVIQQSICDTAGNEHDASLVCELGNPFVGDTEIEIKLDATKIPPHIKHLDMEFKCVTLSPETKLDDNNQTLRLYLQKWSDIGVKGFSSHELILYEENVTLSTTISHTYIVTNHGPSPVQGIDFTLHVPNAILTSDGLEPFLIFTDLDTDRRTQSEVSATCDDSVLEIEYDQTATKYKRKGSDDVPETDFDEEFSNFTFGNVITPSTEPKVTYGKNRHGIRPNNENAVKPSEKREISINCLNQNYNCILLHCTASPFSLHNKFARISVTFKINFKVLENQLGPWNRIEIWTNGYISLMDKKAKKVHKYPDKTQVKTAIITEYPHPIPKTPAWLHFISIIVGGLLLIGVVFLLRKIGFFRRKKKEIMKQMLVALENVEQDDPEDHKYYDIVVYENLQY